MDGGEALVQTLIAHGVDTAFSVPGESYLPILAAIQRAGNSMRLVTPRHESGVTFAAEAYGKLTGRPAACFVSRGPGATNASIGIHTARQDSTPLLLFVGHVPTASKGREAFQEIDHHRFFGDITKAVLEPSSPARVPAVVAEAVRIATTGRPGPVVVIMPKDITEGEAGDVAIPPARPVPPAGPVAAAVAEAAALIDRAARPLVIAGEMVSIEGAHDALARFAEASGAAVTAAYRRQDVMANAHPAYVGHLEINRVPFQERMFAEADLIVAVGARLDGITTQDFSLIPPGKPLVHVFPDDAVLARWPSAVSIAASVAPTLDALAAAVAAPSAPRLAWREALHDEQVRFAVPGEVKVKGTVDLGEVVAAVDRMAPDESVVLCDSGTFARWVHRYYRFRRPHTQAGPMSGAMGYAVPGALGAAMARPEAPVIAFVGDGGFLMSGQEIAAAVQHGLPIKVVVCDNNAWGSILTSQTRRYGAPGEYATRLQSPDFTRLGEGYGVLSRRVTRTDEFEPAFAAALAHEGPALIHLCLDDRDISPFASEAKV